MLNETMLFCGNFPLTMETKTTQGFQVEEDEELCKYGLDVTTYDIFMSNIHKDNQLCQHNGIPWCGTTKKDFVLMSTFIQACCVFRNVVVDFIVNTCVLSFFPFLGVWIFLVEYTNLFFMVGISIHAC
jgi:hypothetical protein